MGPAGPSDVGELVVVAGLGGAEREAGKGGRGGHVGVRVWRRQAGEVRLELVMGERERVRVGGPMMRVHGRRGQEAVRGRGDAQGDLVNDGPARGMRETVTRLEERRGVSRQDRVVVVVVVVRVVHGGQWASRRRVG